MPALNPVSLQSFVLFHAAARNLAVAAEILVRDPLVTKSRMQKLQPLIAAARRLAVEVGQASKANAAQRTASKIEQAFLDLHGFAIDEGT
jgi:hypothetical protein